MRSSKQFLIVGIIKPRHLEAVSQLYVLLYEKSIFNSGHVIMSLVE